MKSKQTGRRKVDATDVRRALLDWYDNHHRDLPWRRDSDPYRVWVSEIMLQQTRVETVRSYYERWITRYPTVDALASGDRDDVLKLWEGLGYYSRARNLHDAARVVRETHSGQVPRNFDELRALPGIGDYTAGAISSIAFGAPVPAVDGNVRRVLSRLYDVAAPNAAAVHSLAAELVDRERPGDFNQGLMELGATICTPRTPSCDKCPLRSSCRARAAGTVELRPGTKPARAVPHETVNTLVRVRDSQVLIAQRPSRGLLGDLWEFPSVLRVPRSARRIGAVTHTFTHKRITYDVFLWPRGRQASANEAWIDIEQLQTYAMPRAQRRIEALVREAWPSPR